MADKFVLTPWEVKGDIDYKKLIKEFGTEVIDDTLLERIKKHTDELHPYLYPLLINEILVVVLFPYLV